MSSNIQIRIGFSKESFGFDTRDEAFAWVRESRGDQRCIISVLTFSRGELEDLTRWYYDGRYFKREDIRR